MRSTTHWVLVVMALSVSAAAQPRETVFTFPSGLADLDAEMRAQLDALASEVKASSHGVIVEGHSDSAGPASMREEISRARAERIATALQFRGVPSSRIEVKWASSMVPAMSNATPEGRAQNRRVVVRVPDGLPGRTRAEGPVRKSEPVAARPERKPTPAEVKPEPASQPTAVVAAKSEPAAKAEPDAAAKPEPSSKTEPAVASKPEPSAETAPVVATTQAPTDAPRRETAPTLTTPEPAPAAAIDFRAEGPKSRTRFWLATTASVVAVASGATAVGLLVDSASAQQGLGTAQAQLARTDLVPESRAAWEAHSTSLNSAVQGDQVDAGVLGAVAVTTAVTAIVLWVQEASSK